MANQLHAACAAGVLLGLLTAPGVMADSDDNNVRVYMIEGVVVGSFVTDGVELAGAWVVSIEAHMPGDGCDWVGFSEITISGTHSGAGAGDGQSPDGGVAHAGLGAVYVGTFSWGHSDLGEVVGLGTLQVSFSGIGITSVDSRTEFAAAGGVDPSHTSTYGCPT